MNKVLVVDDENSITEGLVALFELEDISAAGASDRLSAEAMIAEAFYPVILADLRLHTEADGLKLLESIRRISPHSKVASLTAFATPQVEQRLLELGSSVVLRKPMEFDEIVKVVNDMLLAFEAEAAVREADGAAPLDLDALYQDVSRILYSIPQRKFGFSPEEADELVQEAWCLFLQKRGLVSSPRPWLAGTMVNLCKQQIHHLSRDRSKGAELTEDVASFETETANEASMMVRQALSQVDDRTRKLCILIGMEGWSYEEVADELGLPVGSVGPLYIRAKARLRKVLSIAN